jgi:hypothetical protein
MFSIIFALLVTTAILLMIGFAVIDAVQSCNWSKDVVILPLAVACGVATMFGLKWCL